MPTVGIQNVFHVWRIVLTRRVAFLKELRYFVNMRLYYI